MALMKLTLEVSPFLTTDYTGKFVKTVLINANPELEAVFEDKKYPSPKPIRITPLLDERERPVFIKAEGRRPVNPPSPISIGGVYNIYVGFRNGVEPMLHKAISKLTGGLEIDYGTKVSVRVIGMKVVKTQIPDRFSKVRVHFISPVILADPFARMLNKKRHIKRFLPLSGILFYVNIYELFRKKRKSIMSYVNYALVESHAIMDGIKRIWYYYDGKWLPAIYGVADYLLSDLSYISVIKEILKDGIEMGVGSGRATGFGSVKVEFFN